MSIFCQTKGGTYFNIENVMYFTKPVTDNTHGVFVRFANTVEELLQAEFATTDQALMWLNDFLRSNGMKMRAVPKAPADVHQEVQV